MTTPLPEGQLDIYHKTLLQVFPLVTDIRNSYSASNLRMYTQVDDLIHLEEPLTEEAVIKTLQARFYTGHYYVSTCTLNKCLLYIDFSDLSETTSDTIIILDKV